ncbi:signal transduction histidine kinase [Nonomuraea jabiensis]|uniref:histidine kinase n=2 Tax=Nonomuraea jabiensis TaxID=882448 RepID=A0A7W9G947_9ACTN|nr:signal transduction histidine kinase [Nonomuraea jabiensis]
MGMVTEQTHRAGRLRRPLAALSRLSRFGDVPVVIMLAWAGWLAVPWSFSGLAQARAAAAAAAADTEPPPFAAGSVLAEPPSFAAESVRAELPSFAAESVRAEPTSLFAEPTSLFAESVRAEPAAWGIPAAQPHRLTTVRSTDGAGPDVLAAERARIAGEVHDAAGHGLAAIAMQAGIALVTLDDDPEQARASLRAIRETSTTALAQLRAALDGIDPPRADLAGLIDGVRAAGLPVDVEPADLAVPAHLQAAVYGVVRESLTNVLHHAGPTRVLVRVGEGRGEFVVEVADRGVGRTGAGEGRGLAGMRARVTEAGGHLAAGPREGGGFQVTARFPRTSA